MVSEGNRATALHGEHVIVSHSHAAARSGAATPGSPTTPNLNKGDTLLPVKPEDLASKEYRRLRRAPLMSSYYVGELIEWQLQMPIANRQSCTYPVQSL